MFNYFFLKINIFPWRLKLKLVHRLRQNILANLDSPTTVMGSTVQHSQRQLSKIHMAVAASVKRSWNSAACGCRSERAQRRQIQSKSYRGTTSCEWVETQKYVSKTLRTEFVRGATYSYSYSWMWGECEKWNENEHWAWISLTFGYGGVCCKAENRNKKKDK